MEAQENSKRNIMTVADHTGTAFRTILRRAGQSPESTSFSMKNSLCLQWGQRNAALTHLPQ